MADRLETIKQRKKEHLEREKQNNPYFKEMQNIKSMKYLAKLRQDFNRVAELEAKYKALREKADEHKRSLGE